MSEENGRAAGESLAALLAGGEAGHPALIVPDSGEVLTYTQVAARVEALAQRLAGLGVRRGDRVALALPNGPDVVLLLLAVTALGAAAAPLNPAYTATEYEFFLADIAPRLMLIPASGARGGHRRGGSHRDNPDRRPADGDGPPGTAGRRPGRDAPARVRAGQPGGCRASSAYERNDQPAQAGPAAAAQPHGLGPDDRRALPAGPGGCVVLRDAAVPHSRPGGIHVRGAGRGRRGHRPAPVHAAAVLAAGPRARRDLAVGGPDSAPDDPGQGRRRRPAGHAAVRPVVQFRAGARAPGTGRAGLPGADARGLRHDRGQPSDDVQPAAAGGQGPDLGRGADRHRGRHRGPGGHAAAGRQRRRGRDPRARGDVGIREQPGRHRRGVLRRLVPHRRPRCTARWVPLPRRTDQGDDHPRRREHRPGGDRAGACLASGGARCGLLRRAGRQVRRARRRGGDAPRRRRAQGPDRALPRAARRLQGASQIDMLEEIPRTPTGKVQRRRVGEFVAQRRAGA